MMNTLAGFPDFPNFSDPFDELVAQQSAKFWGIAAIMFFLFIICAIIAKALSINDSERVLKREPLDPSLKEYPQTPEVHSYLPELRGKLKPIEVTYEKYSKQPKQSRLKTIFEPHEVIIPPLDQSREFLLRDRRNNLLKLCILASSWVVSSIILDIWGCIFSYPLLLYIFSKWRFPVITPIEKCTATKIVHFTQRFQPLDLNDLLYGWLNFQKR